MGLRSGTPDRHPTLSSIMVPSYFCILFTLEWSTNIIKTLARLFNPKYFTAAEILDHPTNNCFRWNLPSSLVFGSWFNKMLRVTGLWTSHFNLFSTLSKMFFFLTAGLIYECVHILCIHVVHVKHNWCLHYFSSI